MAKDKVYITLEVGDKGSKVVKSFDKNTERAFDNIKRKARAATASMGASLQKLKSHWMAITAAMAAAGLMVKKIIAVSIAQEKAEVALAAALKVTGEYSKDLAAHFADFASGIQKATTYGDEEVLQLMALQKNLGVATNKLEEATKMSIGLATATGRDVQSMAMYIALAQQGEFTMLRRYIPALRSTTDATEQMKIVTDFAARGFKVAEEQSKTFGGSLKQLTNLFSDLLERYGNVIVKNEAILALFKEGKARLIELIDQFERWLKVNQDLIRQKTYESIDKIKSALSKIWTIISYDPAILEYGIVGLAIGGRKGAVIFGALGHMKTWVENLSAALGIASTGVISFRDVAIMNFKELEALVKNFDSLILGQGPIRMKIEKPEKPELPLLEDATPKMTYDLGLINAELRTFQLQSEAAWAAYQKGEEKADLDALIKKAKEMAAIEYALPFDWEQWIPPTIDMKKVTADQLNAYRLMYSDIKSLAWKNYDLQVELLQKQRDEFLAVTGDQALVAQWYAEKEKELIIEKNAAILESTTDMTEAMAAAWENYILQTKSVIQELAELSIQVAETIAQGIGDAFARAIVYGESLSKSFKDLMKSVAAQIISSLIEIGVQRLIQWVMAQMLNLKEATSRMATLAAETYAGAFAATVAIPIVGPALAPGVAAASTATMLSGAAAAGTAGSSLGIKVAGVAHEGMDYVPRTGTYLLEKGERVTSAEENISDEDSPILQTQVILDGRVLATSVVHRTEIDGILLKRFQKALR